MIDLSTIKKEDFDQHINTLFTFKNEENMDASFELIETSSSESLNTESFRLLFRGPSDVSYPQQLFHFNHLALGVLEIFAVPIRKEDSGIYYEAIFSRFKNKNGGM